LISSRNIRATAGVVALVVLISCICLGGLAGCGGSQDRRYLCAAANAALAATLWVTAGGCRIAGCTSGMRCNPDTELCEPIERPGQRHYPIRSTVSSPEE
jgi:hypothetical protein